MTDADALHCFVRDSGPLPATGAGPLSGVRVAVKDMFAVPGRTSSYGHPRWRETHAPARIRPTHGLVPVAGVLPLAPSLDVVGFLAREPGLLETALEVVATPPAGVRLRRVLTPRDVTGRADAATGEAIAAAARAVAAALGAEVEPVDAEALLGGDVGEMFARVQAREIWCEHGTWAAEHLAHLAPDVQARLRLCEELSRDAPETVQADLDARERYRRTVRDLLGDDAVLVLPVLPRRGPLRAWSADELGAYRGDCFRLTAPASLAGVPEAVVPLGGEAAAGLVGPAGADRALLRLAGALRGQCSGLPPVAPITSPLM